MKHGFLQNKRFSQKRKKKKKKKKFPEKKNADNQWEHPQSILLTSSGVDVLLGGPLGVPKWVPLGGKLPDGGGPPGGGKGPRLLGRIPD